MSQQPLKYVVITGTTHGLGKYCAETLLAKGYHVTMACRNIPLANKLAKQFSENTGNPNYDVLPLELSSFESIREFVRLWKEKNRPIHILINNAGTLDFTGRKTFTPEGYETHFGVNYLGHFLLTQLLLDDLLKNKPALVINLASIGHYMPVRLDDYNNEGYYMSLKAYGRSKLAMLMFTDELQRRYGEKGLTAIASHPGGAHTNIYNSFPPIIAWASPCIMPASGLVLFTPRYASRPTIYAVTHPELWGAGPQTDKKAKFPPHTYEEKNGNIYAQYYGPFVTKSWRTKQSRNVELARKLWEDSLSMVHLTDVPPPVTLHFPQSTSTKDKNAEKAE